MNQDIPPVAERTVCVDFDGTIRLFGPLFDEAPPFPGVVEAMQSLRDAGYYIVILTSRMSPRWWRADWARFKYANEHTFAAANIHYVATYLMKHGIPFDDLTCEKVAALVYWDDRGSFVRSGALGEVVKAWLDARP